MKFVGFLLTAIAASAFAAPDEALLGKDEGYPVCDRIKFLDNRCLVGTHANLDKIYPSRVVKKGDQVRPLKVAAKPVELRYAVGETSGDLESYLAMSRTTGLLILQGDTIALERYQYDRKPDQRLTSWSMAKTLVSMMIGIAMGEGKIRSLDEPASAYVPELAHEYGSTPLRHLLTMSSGVHFTENYSGNDDVSRLWMATAAQVGKGGADAVRWFDRRDTEAGKRFYYASSETQVLALVLRAAVGKPLTEYLSEKIWQPMGAEADAAWLVDAGGYEVAYCCFNAVLRDYARLGMLLANDGALDGKQIIPASWVIAATTPQSWHLRPRAATPYFGYGYQTWIFPSQERQFALLGVRGQSIYVDPKSKTVMVHTAVREASVDGGPHARAQVALWNAAVRTLAP